MDFDKELDIMLSVGWLVHPIDDGVYGVYSSSHKIERRFNEIKKHFKNATIKESENFAQGDYIVNLEGK